MKPQRSTKYRAHRRSKYRYPTYVSKVGQKGDLRVGNKPALENIERLLGRKLREGTKTAHTRTQWVWKEPRCASACAEQ